jgi:hypothetical protein
MRENRTYGSEGGEGSNPFPTPIGIAWCWTPTYANLCTEVLAAGSMTARQAYAALANSNSPMHLKTVLRRFSHPATQSGRSRVPGEATSRHGIWRFATFSRNEHTVACVGHRSSSPKVRQVAIGFGHLLAVTILIGPNRSTTIGLPFASLPCTP